MLASCRKKIAVACANAMAAKTRFVLYRAQI
jgi:hypothetical protein